VTGWTPLEVTAYFAALNFPWIIKPLFGLISDFVRCSAIVAKAI